MPWQTSFGRAVVLGATLLGTEGCSDMRPVERSIPDSLTVHNDRPGPLTPHWRIPADSPTVVIGGSADPDFDLTNTVAVTRRRDGVIFVSVLDKWPIRAYSPTGTLLAKFREGGGPNEFQPGARFVRLPHDSIAAGSFAMGPVKLLDRDFLTTEMISVRDPEYYDFHDRLADGRWVGTRNVPNRGSSRTVARTAIEWVVRSSDFGATRIIKELVGAELVVRVTAQGRSATMPIFGAMTLVAGADTLLYTTRNDTPAIEVWDTSGALVRRFTINLPEEPVTSEDRERYIQDQLSILHGMGKSARQRQHHETALRATPFADKFAYFQEMIIGDDGSIWLGRMRLTSDRRQYLILSSSGKLLAAAEIPARFKLIAAGRADVLVRTQNADDDEMVQVLPIRRPEPD